MEGGNLCPIASDVPTPPVQLHASRFALRVSLNDTPPLELVTWSP